MALQYRLTDGDFFMSVRDCGKQPLSTASIGNDAVHGAEEHLERIRKTFDVSGGIIGVGGNIRSEAGGRAQGHFVGSVAISDMHPFWIFGAPPGRAFGSVDFDSDTIFATGSYLGNRQIAARAIIEL